MQIVANPTIRNILLTTLAAVGLLLLANSMAAQTTGSEENRRCPRSR